MTDRRSGPRVARAVVGVLLLAATVACGSGGTATADDTVGPTVADPVSVGAESVVVPEPTSTQPTPSVEPTAPSDATEPPGTAAEPVPVAAPRWGLDAAVPPDGLGADEVQLRSTLLLLTDIDRPYDDKSRFVDRPHEFVGAHETFMETLIALEDQIELTEPDIVVSGDAATITFSAIGPTIGEIRYELHAVRDPTGWVFSRQSLCDALASSSIAC